LFIPPAVHEELLRFHGTVPTYCQLQPVQDSVRLRRLRTQADAGEAEAICPALDSGADALLIDDKKGRRLAQAEGLRYLGPTGCAAGRPATGLD
jgi:predicted nucleic acid-binding protein